MTNEQAINYLKQLYPNGGHCWLDEQRIEAIGMAVEALKEEPVKEKRCMFTKDNYTDEDRKVLCDGCEEKCAYAIAGIISTNAQVKKEPVSEKQVKESLISKHEDKTCKENGNSLTQEPMSEIDFEQELYKYFGQVKDFTLGMRIAKRFYEIGRNYQESVSEELEQAIDNYLATYFGGEKEKQEWPFLKKMAIHFAEWQKQKDSIPVSEDLEEVIRKYEQRLEKENPATEAYDFASAIRFGANWQKQRMEAYRIEHCKSLTNEQAELEDNFVSSHVENNNRIPTFIDAIEYGMEYCKQQMMAKAVDATVHIDAGGYPYIPQMELYNYEKDIPLAKKGDKYKVILIKEG